MNFWDPGPNEINNPLSRSVITVSRHDLEDNENQMESPPIFSVRV